MSIHHLSHGLFETGGYRHEQSLLKALEKYYRNKGTNVSTKDVRAHRNFSGLAHLKLMRFAFQHAKADVNIVVIRFALFAILRNLFSKRKVLLVWHHYDERERKSMWMRVYEDALFMLLRNVNPSKVAIVAVSSFWVHYFSEKINKNIPVLVFPNLLDVSAYKTYPTAQKEKRIYLGQWAAKNDPQLFVLAKELTAQGYDCYFTSLLETDVQQGVGFEVLFLPRHEYLTQMAKSMYTIAFVKINEGWNRVAHESILVGTQVIGIPIGGLGDLLRESGSLQAETATAFLEHILNHHQAAVKPEFIAKYSLDQAQEYMAPIVDFLNT